MTVEQIVEQLKKLIGSLDRYVFPVGPHTIATHSYAMGVQGRGQEIAHRLQAILDKHKAEKQTYVKPKPLSAAQCACGNFFRCLEEIQLGICAVCISKQCEICPHDPSSSAECQGCALNQPLVPVSDPKEQEKSVDP